MSARRHVQLHPCAHGATIQPGLDLAIDTQGSASGLQALLANRLVGQLAILSQQGIDLGHGGDGHTAGIEFQGVGLLTHVELHRTGQLEETGQHDRADRLLLTLQARGGLPGEFPCGVQVHVVQRGSDAIDGIAQVGTVRCQRKIDQEENHRMLPSARR